VNARHFARRIGRNDRREFYARVDRTQSVELPIIQEHDTAATAGEEFRLVSHIVFIHYCDAVIAVKAAEPAALLPCNVRDTTMRES